VILVLITSIHRSPARKVLGSQSRMRAAFCALGHLTCSNSEPYLSRRRLFNTIPAVQRHGWPLMAAGVDAPPAADRLSVSRKR
jgi:hypothetical protein